MTNLKHISNNIAVQAENGAIKVYLYDTAIITVRGTLMTLATGGFRTPTTKRMLNGILPFNTIWQKNKEWWISDEFGNTSLFYEDMAIDALTGQILSPKES